MIDETEIIYDLCEKKKFKWDRKKFYGHKTTTVTMLLNLEWRERNIDEEELTLDPLSLDD